MAGPKPHLWHRLGYLALGVPPHEGRRWLPQRRPAAAAAVARIRAPVVTVAVRALQRGYLHDGGGPGRPLGRGHRAATTTTTTTAAAIAATATSCPCRGHAFPRAHTHRSTRRDVVVPSPTADATAAGAAAGVGVPTTAATAKIDGHVAGAGAPP